MEAFKDPTILILALSLGCGIKKNGLKEGWYNGGVILPLVFPVIAVSFFSNFIENGQFHKPTQVSNDIQIDVVRSGRRQLVSIYDIVVGDVVWLKIGDEVPADGLFLEGHSLQVDDSSITGESDGVEINGTQNPFLFSGTKVADGFAKMLVTSVGINTTRGQMPAISRDNNDGTPLQVRLRKLTSAMDKIGLAEAFLVPIVLFIRYFIGTTKVENGNKKFNGRNTEFDDIVNGVLGIVVAAGTIAVSAFREAPPMAVILNLAYSMKKMEDVAMVRKVSAFETVGSATTVCTDKTGTLTLNQMKVTKFWLGQQPMAEEAYKSSHHSDALRLIREGVALNTTGSVYKSKSLDYEFSGSPTEKAILSWAVLDLDMNMEELTRNYTIIHMEAFNSKKKRSGVLIRRKADNKIHVHWKRAAEMVLRMCSRYYDASGNVKHLDDSNKLAFEQIIQGLAASSLRCIAFAHREVAEEDEEGNRKVKEEDLTLLGLVGIKNPCHPSVKKAVQDCQLAGVNIKMIIGDNVFTAKAVATECGILNPNQDTVGAVIEGEEFHNWSHEERLEKVEKICVMARSSPFDKLLMVQCLKQKGHVVAVTGDDINDASALKEADIGLSMGVQGTKVTKESSNIVMLDANFASITTVIKWGRCVYNNIQKLIQFQLTVNVVALAINFVAAISSGEVPLRIVHLSWVNMITETLGALALATEKPTKEFMDKPPIRRTQPLITNIVWRNLLAQTLYQILILLTLKFKGEATFKVSSEVNDTLIFNTFVLCQVFNMFNARKLEKKNVFKGIHKNKLFLGIIGIIIVLQVVMVELLKKFADTERLNWGQWGACVIIATSSWPIDWVVKFIPVRKKPLFSFFKHEKATSTCLYMAH